MPNVENLNKLIAHLKKVHRRNFDMADWLKQQDLDKESEETWAKRPAAEIVAMMETGDNKCNTAACIAGHVALLVRAQAQQPVDDEDSDPETIAMEWLDLNYAEAEKLFRPESNRSVLFDGWFWQRQIRRATLPKAIAVLENLVATTLAGKPKVDWRVPIKRTTSISVETKTNDPVSEA